MSKRPTEAVECRGPRRRDILRAGLLSAWGLGLADYWRLSAQETDAPQARPGGKARACVLVWLAGGPSHLDTFDPKPEAPDAVRGEFDPIETSVPGLLVSELFPLLARQMHHATLVRTLTSPEMDHDRATHHKLTGYRPSPALVYPSLGSVVAQAAGASKGALPPFIAIPEPPAFASSGFLPPACDPFVVGGDPSQPSFRVRNLTPPDPQTMARLNRRQKMVEAIDRFAHDVPETPITRGRDTFNEKAFELLTSDKAQQAFRVQDEATPVREAYGMTTLGQSCLVARRLVEAGVPFVTVNDSGGGPLGWDTHAQNFSALRERLAPALDQALAALIADLHDRGLLAQTLVVALGEFGRTPRINENAGRDHHGRTSCVVMAGGGLPGGAIVGRTDDQGDAPAERPVTPSDLAATVFQALGIDVRGRLITPQNQPVRLVDDGKPLQELF